MPDQSTTTVAISIDSSSSATTIDGSKSKLPKMSLESEAKELLSRTGISGVGRRCAEYTPSLEELKSTSFSDYVRGEVLGVPLPGYEFLYIYEDKGGREQKREVPLGQIPPPASTSDATDDEPQGGSSSSRKRTVPSSQQDQQQEMRKTRSRTKAIEVLKRGTCTDNLVPPTAAYLHQPKTYRMCWHKLRDGIAKVSLPTGFWSKMDTTGRGRHWARGSKLGDMVIPSPIKQIISGIGGVYEYSLLEQPPVDVANFRSLADEYRKRHIGKEFDEDQSDEFCDDLARKFWRRLGPTMEAATYGADMEGTLFKDADACGWNVDRLESCLCLLRADATEGDRDDKVFHLPGVTSAYLYFGMWASVFAAHTEDMNLLSINYLHAGSPKYWYAIAQEDSKRFESLARSHFSGPASECHEFLRHKRCLLSPAILKKAGIKFTTCIQRPGDARFNIAESTNFAVPEWIPLGEKAGICMCHPHSVRIQMKRLKSLLERYEQDMCYRESMGLPNLTYTNWAKYEAKRLKKKLRQSCLVDHEGDHGSDRMELPTTINTSIAVEVTTESISPKKKSNKRSFTKHEFHEWRLAKRVRPGLFVPGTSVICAVECEESPDHLTGDDDHASNNGFEFFLGNVVKQVDEHVKVHLIGLGKKDDLWFERDSSCLFIDGGVTDSPAQSDGRKGNSQQKKKQR